jgi:superfamily II DNA/RNA helicase
VKSTFAELGVPAALAARLSARGIDEPFPIQAATLPDALAGRDLCGRAPTGSGKTLAFGLAIAARVAKAAPHHPTALVLVPTRELAAQVRDELSTLLDRRRVLAVYGGTGYEGQRRPLAKGVDVVVACPGRLEDLLASGVVKLDRAGIVVLDEADRMADMGFMPAVRRILDRTPADRQTLLFSATLDGEVDALVQRYQRDPARHEVHTPEDEQGDVEHLFWDVPRADRVRSVAKAIERHGRTVVFCRTRHGADRIAKQLGALGVQAVALHGSRTQAQRDRAIAAFSSGRVDALVATDVAARGIHVDGVTCVVHLDPPATDKDYIHRSGRTGRAGASGTVISIVAEDQRAAVRALQRSLGLGPAREEAGPRPQRPAARPGRPAPGDATGRRRSGRPGGGRRRSASRG